MRLALPSSPPCYSDTTAVPRNTLSVLIVLLQILMPALSSLSTINPWLSACDLESTPTSAACLTPRRPADCRQECTQQNSHTQCLSYLHAVNRSVMRETLGTSYPNDKIWKENYLSQLHLQHCCEYTVLDVLPDELLHKITSSGEFVEVLESIKKIDWIAGNRTCEFAEILTRFDCDHQYSIRANCSSCQVAYRQWVCSSLFPYHRRTPELGGRRRIKPCRSYCEAVEQQCPYFLPENLAPLLLTQYAGEPTFLCLDPHIPETGEQLSKSMYPADDSCCYKHCPNSTDLCVPESETCGGFTQGYVNATLETVECSMQESIMTRTTTSQCPSYSSPYNLGSGATTSRPIALLLPASLAVTSLSILFHLIQLRVVNFLFLFCLVLKEKQLRAGSRRVLTVYWIWIKHFYYYFLFNSRRWQYYFILISANLLPPLGTSRGGRTRGAAVTSRPLHCSSAQTDTGSYRLLSRRPAAAAAATTGLSRWFLQYMWKCVHEMIINKKYRKNYYKKRFKKLCLCSCQRRENLVNTYTTHPRR